MNWRPMKGWKNYEIPFQREDVNSFKELSLTATHISVVEDVNRISCTREFRIK